ncbi:MULTISPECIES: acyl-CoA dehydrogenase family protein [unclassified Acinetobacter]|uniref:acyl-CoA dehydrogenase family protein n=1 Tax=unclassified Acinetobacter TaxID=196816 RepID=UPI0029352227|nr:MULTISPECIES: acyl-CoA dehydrogenase family protein [unclassified Acinetobacter]WOE32392.1 acyl-CoA dehydrogenase family protein [Acinetobacter sp. SAAs470]WOE37865.1 acyl-CoA dehydrogenase family protein [Acinetobacter sp. SAAs474]
MILNEQQKMVQEMMREYAQHQLKPTAAARDKTAQFPAQQLQELGQLGALGMTVAEEWGGAALDYVSLVLALEEIAAGDGAISTIVSVQNSLPCGILQSYGTVQQKQQYLTKLATGEWLGCFCLTEPQTGSDASAITCKATKEGDEWVLNGTKQFITTGKYAQIALVLAVTDKAAGKKGISCFLVPTDNPGYVVAGLEDKMGQHCSDTATIILDNCRIPADHLLGKIGEGYKIALSNLASGRIGIAAQSLGMARAALDAAVAYANQRQAFGVELVQHQAIAFRLADMATQIEAARQLTLHAASLKDAGLPCLKEASMAKLFASTMAERVCSDAIQIHGGYGYVADFPVERIYRDVRVSQIYEGTSDIQRLVIAREVCQV